MKDYYKILGVSKTASVAELKKQFRKKALLLHPDKSGRDTKDEFIELFEAYEMLVDPKKRERYDLIYDWIGTPTAEVNENELIKTVVAIHERGAGYARSFSKFNSEVIFYIVIDLLFSNFMLGAVALIIVGIFTVGKGVINFKLDYFIIGLALTSVGIWFAKLRVNWLAEKSSAD